MAVLDRRELEESPLSDLHAIASELGIEGYRRLRREQLIEAILGGDSGSQTADRGDAAPSKPEPEPEEEPGEVRSGVLDILPNGSGFMRPEPFAHSAEDVYVSPAQIRRCELRAGDSIEGPVRSPRRNERHPSLVRIDKVNGGA